jgi:hypothetical protein
MELKQLIKDHPTERTTSVLKLEKAHASLRYEED